MGLTQSRLGAGEIAAQAPDIADRIEPVRLRRRRLVRLELGRRTFELLLSLVPCAADRRHLRPMDPADSREPRQRLTVAIALGRLYPFRRPAVIREVPTGADHPASRHAGREWRQLAIDGRDRCLLHERDAVDRQAGRDLERGALTNLGTLKIG